MSSRSDLLSRRFPSEESVMKEALTASDINSLKAVTLLLSDVLTALSMLGIWEHGRHPAVIVLINRIVEISGVYPANPNPLDMTDHLIDDAITKCQEATNA